MESGWEFEQIVNVPGNIFKIVCYSNRNGR